MIVLAIIMLAVGIVALAAAIWLAWWMISLAEAVLAVLDLISGRER